MVERCVANGHAEGERAGAYLGVMQTRTSRGADAVAHPQPLLPLRSTPMVVVAFAAVLFTLWLARADLQPHSLFADPLAATASSVAK